MAFWFEKSAEEARRDAKERLKQAARDSARQDESQINTWLELAKKLFDRDNDPDPSAA